MKDEIRFFAIGILFFLVAFITSLLLDISWIRSHWIREALTLLMIFLELTLGALILIQILKQWQQHPNEK